VTWNRFCVVPCGTRNDEPSTMLGKVSCGTETTGSIRLRNVLYDAEKALTIRGLRMRVHEPTID
jgi:hypothetical protein